MTVGMWLNKETELMTASNDYTCLQQSACQIDTLRNAHVQYTALRVGMGEEGVAAPSYNQYQNSLVKSRRQFVENFC